MNMFIKFRDQLVRWSTHRLKIHSDQKTVGLPLLNRAAEKKKSPRKVQGRILVPAQPPNMLHLVKPQLSKFAYFLIHPDLIVPVRQVCHFMTHPLNPKYSIGWDGRGML
jgi:hypothetical protein